MTIEGVRYQKLLQAYEASLEGIKRDLSLNKISSCLPALQRDNPQRLAELRQELLDNFSNQARAAFNGAIKEHGLHTLLNELDVMISKAPEGKIQEFDPSQIVAGHRYQIKSQEVVRLQQQLDEEEAALERLKSDVCNESDLIESMLKEQKTLFAQIGL